MSHKIFLPIPQNFDFGQTVLSHGWYQLAPFSLDTENRILKTVLNPGKPISVEIRQADNQIEIRVFDRADERLTQNIVRSVGHILRFDDNFDEFHEQAGKEKNLEWIAEKKAGRLLRSPTVFEDLVKTLCTTNCSWALTKIMVTNLVEKLGQAAQDGRRAFPTAEAMAKQAEDFYRQEIRAGYRAGYFVELARKITSGKLDVEKWFQSEMPTAELKKEMKKVKGVGNYAAENLLKLLGRYDGLALDSYLRGQFYKKHNGGNPCADKQIEIHYEKFGVWRGLAIWCDMTGR